MLHTSTTLPTASARAMAVGPCSVGSLPRSITVAAALPYDRLSPCIVKITGMFLFGWAAIFPIGCSSDSQNADIRNNLDAMDSAVIQIKDQGFQVWLATTPEQQERGLM